MVDRLPSMLPRIDSHSEALIQSVCRCLLGCYCEQVPQQGFMLSRRVRERGEMQARDDEQMDRRLWRDVWKGEHLLVLIHGIYWDLPICDPAKKASHIVSIVQ